MELPEVINTQFAFHGIVVGLVLVCAILVFVFGFKSVEEFPFDKLTNAADDRKPAGKKRKVKDKKVQSNGHATAVGSDKGDNKQKTDNAAAKGNPAKSTTKDKKEAEKIPAKESTKVAGKQEKKQTVKAETSPNKSALKETKNIKDHKKNITEENQKQIKEKKGDASEKASTKAKQMVKNKGKENVEVKNKKNTEKAPKKVKVTEEKPKDDEEGEWEQAVYRKDKKKKTTAIDEEIISDKSSVKKDVSSPSKKKKSKSAEIVSENEQVTSLTTSVAETTPVPVDTEQVKPEQKQAKKEPKVKPSEEVTKETELTPVDAESDAKSVTKKKKKKSGKENVESNILSVEKDAAVEVPVAPAPSKPKKVEARATVEVFGDVMTAVLSWPARQSRNVTCLIGLMVLGSRRRSPVRSCRFCHRHRTTAKPASSSQTKPEVVAENTATAVFDELGDIWKEAKAPKKSNKKKVRKDQ